jgi:polyisoprenoid-binding protein YceI
MSFPQSLFARLVAVAALSALALLAEAAERYTIDANHTQVRFYYGHLGLSRLQGLLTGVEGEFQLDTADLTRSSIDVRLPIASLSTGLPRLDEHLKSPDFFDAERFPQARFRSLRVVAAGENRLHVTGELTIHGVTREEVMEVTVNGLREHPMRRRPAAGFDGRLLIRRSEYGIGAAASAVGDEVSIEISMESYQPAAE